MTCLLAHASNNGASIVFADRMRDATEDACFSTDHTSVRTAALKIHIFKVLLQDARGHLRDGQLLWNLL